MNPKSNSLKEAIGLAVLVSISTCLTVVRQEWIAAGVGGFLAIGAWIQVGILAERRKYTQIKVVLGEAYQACGAGGAPERLLDNLSAAGNGKTIPHKSILPVSPDEWNRL